MSAQNDNNKDSGHKNPGSDKHASDSKSNGNRSDSENKSSRFDQRESGMDGKRDANSERDGNRQVTEPKEYVKKDDQKTSGSPNRA